MHLISASNLGRPVDSCQEEEPQRRLPCLDGLRAVGIGLVILAHLQNVVGWHPTGLAKTIWEGFGPLGVTIFFGLSGYLITHLLLKEFSRTGTVSLKNFFMRRVLRIFPAFYFYLFVIWLLVFSGNLEIPTSQLLRASGFLTNYFRCYDTPHFWFIGHTWSLAVEEQFYLIWPALLLFGGIWHGKKIALLLIAMMPVIRVAIYHLLPEARPNLGETTHTSADLLMYGCLLALLDGNPRFEQGMERIGSWIFPAGAIVFLLIGHPLLEVYFRGAYKLTLGISLEAGLISFVIAWVLRHPISIGASFLNSRIMVHFGVLSYSLYLWQQPFLTKHNPLTGKNLLLGLLLTYVAALASYFLIEKKFMAFRRSYR